MLSILCLTDFIHFILVFSFLSLIYFSSHLSFLFCLNHFILNALHAHLFSLLSFALSRLFPVSSCLISFPLISVSWCLSHHLSFFVSSHIMSSVLTLTYLILSLISSLLSILSPSTHFFSPLFSSISPSRQILLQGILVCLCYSARWSFWTVIFWSCVIE